MNGSRRVSTVEKRQSHGNAASRRGSTFPAADEQVMSPSAAAAAAKSAEEEAVERILKAGDPNVMSTPVYFDYKKDARVFKLYPSVGPTAVHLALDGVAVHKDSPEVVRQVEDAKRRQEEVEAAAEAELNPELIEEGVSTRILKNQFNYNDRGSQTMNNVKKERTFETDPPPAATFGGMATAWAIYDTYEAERLQAEKVAAAQRKAAAAHRAGKDEEGALVGSAQSAMIRDESSVGPVPASDIVQSDAFRRAAQLMERMVNQNDCFDIIDDFRYWEDTSDLYKEDGTLLPLWQFHTEKKKRAVTCVALNGRYDDLFAVGYGSYDFQKVTKGTVHCFTLKNAVPTTGATSPPAHPEFSLQTESGVLCMAFHPSEPSLLACGLHDGSVCVFDLRVKNEKQKSRPLYQATVRTGKHTDPVWQVFWKRGTNDLSFYSVSTDGRITNWELHKKEITSKEVIQLDTGAVTSDPEAMVLNQLGGMCMDYSEAHDLVAVGTQEGAVLLCTTSYNGQCVERFDGHAMAVYAVHWNPFHTDIFLTCSADWTVKLWLKSSPQPLLTFDLGDAVGDVAWSHTSASVFAAVTSNGKVVVFDLSQNKTEPLCVQTVVKNAKLTHIVFSKVDPIVFVGDSRGTVLTLKLSPNLRKVTKPAKGEPDDPASLRQKEVEKLSRLVEITMKDRALLA